ncbi:MAG: FAD-dependent oxidoreductase [Pseudomonadota bacterium]
MSKLSRRQFLLRMSAAGGSAAVYNGLLGMGLMPQTASAADWQLGDAPRPLKVLVLGGGLSGLVAAYELRRRGFVVEVLEASHRVGGRNFTVRSGTLIDEIGNRQVCDFDSSPDLYFNAGPARIPTQHQRILGYCRELGVPLEVFVNYNGQAWVHDPALPADRRVRMREYVTDARGFMAEMMTKNLRPQDLDQPMTDGDAERLRDFLRRFGDLDAADSYKGSSRAGYASGGVMAPGIKKETLDFPEMLSGNIWRIAMNFSEAETMMAPLMQMVGGNDAIIRALEGRLEGRIRYRAQVTGINVGTDAVTVRYAHGGVEHTATADYCLNCIPGPILTGIENNFPQSYVDALEELPRGHLIKVAFQARERFWERDLIYGGISWTTDPIQQLLYPSGSLHGQKGVVVGAYVFGRDHALRFTHMTHEERTREAIEQGEKLHPGYGEYLEKSASVAWWNMNHMLGCASHVAGQESEETLTTLKTPFGRHIMMGDQTSHHSGWQEGAVGSAHAALNTLNTLVRANA